MIPREGLALHDGFEEGSSALAFQNPLGQRLDVIALRDFRFDRLDSALLSGILCQIVDFIGIIAKVKKLKRVFLGIDGFSRLTTKHKKWRVGSFGEIFSNRFIMTGVSRKMRRQ